MAIRVTLVQANDRLAELLDKVTRDREIVIIRRRGTEAAAMIPAKELASLVETAYLLRSSRSAERLLTALSRAREQFLPKGS